jgi:hypothetical protein
MERGKRVRDDKGELVYQYKDGRVESFIVSDIENHKNLIKQYESYIVELKSFDVKFIYFDANTTHQYKLYCYKSYLDFIVAFYNNNDSPYRVIFDNIKRLFLIFNNENGECSDYHVIREDKQLLIDFIEVKMSYNKALLNYLLTKVNSEKDPEDED